MKKTFLLGLMALVLVGGGCFSQEQSDSTTVIDRDSILFEAKEQGLIMDESEVDAMNSSAPDVEAGEAMTEVDTYFDVDVDDWNSGALADVTGGGSFGLAYTNFENGQYTMIAKLGGLPDPGEGYFYEGWVVRRGEDLSVISTGEAVRRDEDWYGNVFLSSTDLTDHDFYVLTLEPDDGDPAPAEHILEGVIK